MNDLQFRILVTTLEWLKTSDLQPLQDDMLSDLSSSLWEAYIAISSERDRRLDLEDPSWPVSLPQRKENRILSPPGPVEEAGPKIRIISSPRPEGT